MDGSCTCDTDSWACPLHCPVCDQDELRPGSVPHWCHPRREFVGDPTMSALEFEIEHGDPAPKGGDDV